MRYLKKFDIFKRESLVNQKSLDQLKAIRKLSKGIDIGDRVKKMNGANLAGESNFIDDNPETIEQYFASNKNFKINQNAKNFSPSKSSKLNESLTEGDFQKLLTMFTFAFLCSYLSSGIMVNLDEICRIIEDKCLSHDVVMRHENDAYTIYCSNSKCLSVQTNIMVSLIQDPTHFPVKWARIDPEKTESYGFFREYLMDTCMEVIEKISKDKQYAR